MITTVYFEPRYIAIDIENSLDEPIRLYCNHVFLAEVPAGGNARCRAPEGDVLMQAYKSNSKTWLQQTIHEHRDFIWRMPKPKSQMSAKPALSYLESVTPAPKVTGPAQGSSAGGGPILPSGHEQVVPQRAQAPQKNAP